MELGLQGKVAFVGGSSSGLGRAIARTLAAEGCRVAVSARSSDTLAQTAQEIRSEWDVDVFEAIADLSRREEAAAAVTGAEEMLGPVDILVTNVGGPPSGRFQEISYQQWENAFQLTMGSALHLIHLVLPAMREKKWGRIINITSISVKQPVENLVLSNAIRAAVTGMAKTLSTEVAGEGITVNNVLPGFTRTERLTELASALADKRACDEAEVYRSWESEIPAGRLGEPEELANLVAFLASERASYITGTSVQVDGGWVRSLL